jgi:hypothetical protein
MSGMEKKGKKEETDGWRYSFSMVVIGRPVN